MKSVMAHQFSQIPSVNIPRSQFNRSCGYKTTFNSGYLIPVFTDEVLPGDTLNLRMSVFARLATPQFPFMDNVFLDSFFFFVPIRLLWDNWQKFNGEQKNPGDSTDFLVPIVSVPASGGFANGTLYDYFGVPTGVNCTSSSYKVTNLMGRAYNLIYNEWFRDQNLVNSAVVDVDDGPDDPADYVLRRRGKRHDYFTSCLPWPQKGPAVQLPLGTSAPVTYDAGAGNALSAFSSAAGHPKLFELQTGSTPNHLLSGSTNDGGTGTSLYADLSTATAATINQLRQAFQIQRLYERDARGGTRYTEILQSHFGVVSPDARLQRPEYLGGGSSPINIHPVAQTSQTDTGTPQGNLAAFGTTSASGHGFVRSFVEHGVIIGLICVRADLTYQQGLNKKFSRRSRFEFYWPSLAHLGEQAVLNQEIYLADDATQNAAAFGYQERFAEYRYMPSQITGQFRSNYVDSLDAWHLAQEFSSLPLLNSTFIAENPPISRVIAVPSEPEFLFDSYFSIKSARPMPTYSVPGLIDHF